ncbi:MAG TPA: PAS domain-containing protein [Verrucomicrobiae bacterium]|nr:PAS domain-containing protein [Verrucomicrobiae bacterium]
MNQKTELPLRGLSEMLPQLHSHTADLLDEDEGFRQLAESIGAVFWMTDFPVSRVLYVSPGYERIWGRSCASLRACADDWFDAIHDEDRERILQVISVKQSTGEFDEEYRIIRPDGAVRWVHGRVFPVRNEAGEIYRLAGIAEDITDRKRLEQEIIEIGDRDLSRLGQDLHDGICQQLVSIAFASDLLRRDLMAKLPSEAVRVARITALLDNAITQARNLSHTLCPVNLAGNGLGVALRELAMSTTRGLRVVCDADCQEGVVLRDQAAATHLYRIALEAVQSAVKHAGATRILISLRRDGDNLQLSITDNGQDADSRNSHEAGVELNIMRYRANMAGGALEVHPNPFGGTVITCSCPQKPD